MGGILDKLDEWLRGLLVDGITGNLSGMFDTVNTKVGEIAGEVGMTPLAWNSGVFSMIRNLSETVIVPIAGVILTFVMCYELIQLVTEKNNMHDVDMYNAHDASIGMELSLVCRKVNREDFRKRIEIAAQGEIQCLRFRPHSHRRRSGASRLPFRDCRYSRWPLSALI